MWEAWAKRYKITVPQAKRLAKMVNKAAKAQEDDRPDATVDRLCAQVDFYAGKLKMGVDWRPGIYPLLIKGDESSHLPE